MTDDADAPGGPRRADGAPWRNFYGRRRGKTLRDSQRSLLGEALARVRVPGVEWDENTARRPLDLAALLPGAREVWLEIGFGGGEHLLAEAAANPDIGLIGCEPFLNGVAMCLAAMVRAPAPNVRLHPGDARFLFDVLPPASLGRVYLLYPDPWPKNRHVARRFVNPENLDRLAALMRPGAELRVATDIEAYARHTQRVLAERADFAAVAADPRAPWPGWPGTRYEAKARAAGRRPFYLRFARR